MNEPTHGVVILGNKTIEEEETDFFGFLPLILVLAILALLLLILIAVVLKKR